MKEERRWRSMMSAWMSSDCCCVNTVQGEVIGDEQGGGEAASKTSAEAVVGAGLTPHEAVGAAEEEDRLPVPRGGGAEGRGGRPFTEAEEAEYAPLPVESRLSLWELRAVSGRWDGRYRFAHSASQSPSAFSERHVSASASAGMSVRAFASPR